MHFYANCDFWVPCTCNEFLIMLQSFNVKTCTPFMHQLRVRTTSAFVLAPIPPWGTDMGKNSNQNIHYLSLFINLFLYVLEQSCFMYIRFIHAQSWACILHTYRLIENSSWDQIGITYEHVVAKSDVKYCLWFVKNKATTLKTVRARVPTAEDLSS